MSHVGVVGVTVHPYYWRKGYGRQLLKADVEQAKKEGFVRLEADTLAKSKAMRRIAEKAGFKLEGTRKKRLEVDGRFYRITNKEYYGVPSMNLTFRDYRPVMKKLTSIFGMSPLEHAVGILSILRQLSRAQEKRLSKTRKSRLIGLFLQSWRIVT